MSKCPVIVKFFGRVLRAPGASTWYPFEGYEPESLLSAGGRIWYGASLRSSPDDCMGDE